MVRGRRLAVFWFALAGAALVRPAAAYDVDYSVDRPQALRDCDAQRFRGERGAAAACYAGLQLPEQDLRIRAEAAWALGNYESAGDLFQAAFEAFPDDPRLRARWGALFAETNELQLGIDLSQEALVLDPEYAPAIVTLAQIAAGRFEGRAREFVDRALSADPDATAAHLLLARMELEVGNIDLAEASLELALELIEQRGDPPVEVYALKAAADLQRGVPNSPW
jgi:tetratricopeptide (TPR) repeat protein